MLRRFLTVAGAVVAVAGWGAAGAAADTIRVQSTTDTVDAGLLDGLLRVTKDGVMAQVELACGPYRIVSLMSREAADELGLAPGVDATAVIKSTNVVIDLR